MKDKVIPPVRTAEEKRLRGEMRKANAYSDGLFAEKVRLRKAISGFVFGEYDCRISEDYDSQSGGCKYCNFSSLCKAYAEAN